MKNKLVERRWWTPIGITCAMIVMLTTIGTHAGEVSEVEVKIKRVALFKNGLGYFTSSATLPKGATTIKIKQLPVPAHGTFWVGYPKGMKVSTLFTSKEDVEGTKPAHSITDLLQVNLGRKVTISTGSKDMPQIVGTIVDIKLKDQHYQIYPLVVIKTEDGTVAINAGSITRADFAGDDITTSVPTVLRRTSIRMELEKAAKGQEIGISYLARGITWSPSYLIDLSDSNTARLSAKAVVINEVAHLEKIHLDLVSGFPNIKFGDVNSPVAMSQNLAGFLGGLSSGQSVSIRGGRAGSVMLNQAMLGSEIYSKEEKNRPIPEYSTADQGTVSEDLYLYPVEDFTLHRNETATIPLFTAELAYKHVYIWKIPDILDSYDRYRYRQEEDKQPLGEVVWHSCRLVNSMEMPLTTAAAEFVKDGQFTGQDICYYTAPGAETTIRINRAMNIVAEKAEFEVERQRDAARIYGSSYDLVKVKGELKLKNRMDKSATVEVIKKLSGEVLEIVPQAEDIPTAKGLQRVNTRHVLVWKIELKAGEKQTLSYTYEVYVRN